MRMRTLFVLAVSAVAASTACAQDVARSVDAGGFDVAGVKLGMTRSQAVAAATDKLHVAKGAIQFDKFPQVNPVTKTKEPANFTATNGSGTLSVYFFPKIPFDKANPMVVGMVKYEMPRTPENAQSMKAAALEKYGQPSNGTLPDSFDWCSHPNKNIGIGCFDFQGPKLKYHGVSVELTDPTYQAALVKFINKSQSSRPAF